MNITRRGFISMLALAGTGAVLLPNRKIFLPPTRDFFAEYCAKYGHGDFTTENLRFKYTERYSYTDWRAIYGSSAELSEETLAKSLEDLAVHGRSVIAIKPTRLLVHPDKVEAAKVAFPGQVEARYFAYPNTWHLKTGSDDPKVVELFERLAHGAGMQTTREFYGTKSQGQG